MAETKTTVKRNKNQNNENDSETSDAKRKVSLARADTYGLFYADAVQLSISAYDFKLTFSVNQTLLNGDVLITELSTVVLTPQHAKELATRLAQNVVQYEKDVMSLEVKEDFEQKQKKFLASPVGE